MTLARKVLTLSNGLKVPVLGLGTWRSEVKEVGHAVYTAIVNGYRHIDCAAVYMNEGEIGETLKRVFSEGIVKREDLFIVTKLWNTCHKKEHVEPALKNSLALLGLDYVDMYLVHFPVAFEYNGRVGENGEPDAFVKKVPGTNMISFSKNTTLQETWAGMEAVYAKGYTKSIGVSNYTIPVLLDLMNYAKVPPVVNQIEVNPYLQRNDLRKLCKSLNIAITAYSPLGAGVVSIMSDPVIVEIAKKHGASPAQVIIAWSVQQGNIVIPKSVKEQNIKSNVDIKFTLTDDDMERIKKLDKTYVCLNTEPFWGINVNAF